MAGAFGQNGEREPSAREVSPLEPTPLRCSTGYSDDAAKVPATPSYGIRGGSVLVIVPIRNDCFLPIVVTGSSPSRHASVHREPSGRREHSTRQQSQQVS